MSHNWRVTEVMLYVMCVFVTWFGNLPVAVLCGFSLNSLKPQCSGSDRVARDKARESSVR